MDGIGIKTNPKIETFQTNSNKQTDKKNTRQQRRHETCQRGTALGIIDISRKETRKAEFQTSSNKQK